MILAGSNQKDKMEGMGRLLGIAYRVDRGQGVLGAVQD